VAAAPAEVWHPLQLVQLGMNSHLRQHGEPILLCAVFSTKYSSSYDADAEQFCMYHMLEMESSSVSTRARALAARAAPDSIASRPCTC
jgi:hypothetical protein